MGEPEKRFPPPAGEISGRSGPMVRTIMVNCACGKHQIVSGQSLNDIEEEAKEKAKERATEKGWTLFGIWVNWASRLSQVNVTIAKEIEMETSLLPIPNCCEKSKLLVYWDEGGPTNGHGPEKPGWCIWNEGSADRAERVFYCPFCSSKLEPPEFKSN